MLLLKMRLHKYTLLILRANQSIIIIIKFLFILGQVKKRNTCVKTSREYAHSYTHSHTIKQKTKEIKMSSNKVGLKRIVLLIITKIKQLTMGLTKLLLRNVQQNVNKSLL